MSKLKIIPVMLLLITIISTMPCSFADATSDGTYVSNDIRRDTLWTKENSPYILKDDITIRSGVSLIIQEGVVVDFSLWSLKVDGVLQAYGNEKEHIEFHFPLMPLTVYEDARIVFTEKSQPWKETTNRGCQLEYVDIFCGENAVQYGLIEGGTLKLDHVTIHDTEPLSKYYTLDINGSITNSQFIRVTRAIYMDQGRIVDNIFLSSSSYVITIHNGLVRDNLIDGGLRGINVKNALIKNNTIINVQRRGINIYNIPTTGSTIILKPIIHFNLISNCGGDAIYVSGANHPIITQNLLIENKNGIYFDKDAFYAGAKPKIYYNAFYSNINNVYFNREDPRIEIKIQNNWWGTNEADLIEDKIYYECDDPRLTAALYQPILTEAPYFLPKIPFKLTISQLDQKVKVNDIIHVSGEVYPPLDGLGLEIRYCGPYGQAVSRNVSTDAMGSFLDAFTPESAGIWDITVESMENEVLNSHSVSTQVNVTEVKSKTSDIPIETITETEIPPSENTTPPTTIEDESYPEPTPTESPSDETTETETIPDPVAQIEEETPDDLSIIGLILSLLTFLITITLHFALNIVKIGKA